ncbi:hypothetical protein FOCG_11411 [Fusarium oxysporum f. sp. radicis-lycopersici 26381]|uniref:Uncharacterized protein n=3 Tax=Fusarium oxysporum TaxID=5507 RepID=A0A0J9WJV1_FUSO4|nr:hypothetical protein FOXG_18791 [Fusarium oxysporum f. sp. lycopersici 4287]EWZ46704.1 hypothetical protein FOZG_02794 [Fusarium oxysporum Fo47]EWZ84713.1 hypothetical protein FOWG_12457 [Fusarium oxysporum f. sp. lycopersici MN25]EXK44001.1 hypothetical protein FOMG_02869 [Fusarium oxysporum f. sp. melonis 26406]EXL47190.1 hypothetical protein FOCG_11411 [Fusarium oxysporum f. sp. radicis-lycopersici 26381]KNB00922.1 hypothetical protein FOXG_18791 [Fusarium oxysporum f. sp. lycopersici 42
MSRLLETLFRNSPTPRTLAILGSVKGSSEK